MPIGESLITGLSGREGSELHQHSGKSRKPRAIVGFTCRKAATTALLCFKYLT